MDGFKLEEIHLFSYFSSFLYFYAGNALGTWQHRYIAVSGYPFSQSINEAIIRHIQNGLFEDKGEYYIVTGRGAEEFNKFKVQSLFAKREAIMNAACTTSILVPYSQTLRALLNEPEVKKQTTLDNGEWLDQMNFYPQFKELSEAVGIQTQDLLIPAVSLINILSETEKSQQ